MVVACVSGPLTAPRGDKRALRLRELLRVVDVEERAQEAVRLAQALLLDVADPHVAQERRESEVFAVQRALQGRDAGLLVHGELWLGPAVDRGDDGIVAAPLIEQQPQQGGLDEGRIAGDDDRVIRAGALETGEDSG